jgi:peptidoglycan/LPS O-acetylase OafA/YrhL
MSLSIPSNTAAPAADSGALAQARPEPRIIPLDGLRGLMTIFVVISHYFAELPNGQKAFAIGWIGVEMFFVLSGFLVGNLILEKAHHANFLKVFYIRRVCRTFPVYFGSVIVIMALMTLLGPRDWIGGFKDIPAWSYFTFTQNYFMAVSNDVGMGWLAPTWTLAVEEQFYLIVPALFLLTPRRYLVSVLVAIGVAAIGLRSYNVLNNPQNLVAALAQIHVRADTLVSGLLLAVVWKQGRIDYARHALLVRSVPLVIILIMLAISTFRSANDPLFIILSGPLMGLACAAFILMLVENAPEAERFHSPFLRFFSRTSYSIYLTHLMVLGLMHGLVLGAKPDLATVEQLLVTLAALPVCVALGYVMTRIFEEPLTAFGRSFKWSTETRSAPRPEARA